jgi:hypothetical protein
LGRLTIASVSYWLTIIIAMHVLEPEFNPMQVPMSAYVAGAYGGWMTTTFFALAIALIATAFGLCATLRTDVLAWISFLLFIVAAVGVVVAGIFPGIIDGHSSVHWHAIGSQFAFPGMALGSLLFSLSFFSVSRRQRIAVPALTLSVGVVLAFLLWPSPISAGRDGLVQRIFFALMIPWFVLVGMHLMRTDRSARPSAESR